VSGRLLHDYLYGGINIGLVLNVVLRMGGYYFVGFDPSSLLDD